MSDFQHPIQAVVRRTGLSAHVIRIWEKRYGAVEPERTVTNRRLYSDAQIERLTLLRAITQAGQSIGYVAKLPTEKLAQLAAASPVAGEPTGPGASPAEPASSFLNDSLAAIRALDARALERTLNRSETALGAVGMLRQLAAPLAKAIGDAWREGTITAAHEHFASAVLRTYLAQAAKTFVSGANDPVLVVTTPAGQLHELGALLAAAMAANLGWHVSYLGASLPAPEIAGAAKQNRARAVALSLVYPSDDPRMDGELTRLRDLLPPEVKLIAGGQAAPAYRAVLDRVGAVLVGDLAQLSTALDEFRTPATGAGESRPAE